MIICVLRHMSIAVTASRVAIIGKGAIVGFAGLDAFKEKVKRPFGKDGELAGLQMMRYRDRDCVIGSFNLEKFIAASEAATIAKLRDLFEPDIRKHIDVFTEQYQKQLPPVILATPRYTRPYAQRLH